MTRKFRSSAADAGKPLAEWIADRLGVEVAEARRAVETGAVYVDRKRQTDPEAPLRPGQTVGVREPAGAGIEPLVILLATDEVVAVDKPAGVPSQATRDSIAAADRWVIDRYPDARLVHRLDRDTRGVLLFSRDKAAHRAFCRWRDEGALERIYTAVVWGKPGPEAGVIDRPIGPDPSDRRRQKVGSGKPARTEYQVEAVGQSRDGHAISRLSLRLITGRTHQIRAHLAAAGHPVCGDPLYCSLVGVDSVGELALWARRLAWPQGSVESKCGLNIPILDDVLT